MKVAVVGSRDYPDANRRVYNRLKSLREDFPHADLHIISGGARGVDSAAVRAAGLLGIPYTIFNADWDGLGKRAGHVRNQLIVEASDRVIAYWDFESRDTEDSIRMALKAGLHVEVWDAQNQPAGPRAAEAVMGR